MTWLSLEEMVDDWLMLGKMFWKFEETISDRSTACLLLGKKSLQPFSLVMENPLAIGISDLENSKSTPEIQTD